MVVVKYPENWIFVKFEKSNYKNKKYNAILKNKLTNKYKKIPFGDKTYQQYFDKTGLGYYSHLNHYDKKRKKNYRSRHKKTAQNKFSSSWFSYYYLW